MYLPRSHEGWEKANNFFQQHLVPLVISEFSADSKYKVLADGVFAYFSANIGTAKGDITEKGRSNSRLVWQDN